MTTYARKYLSVFVVSLLATTAAKAAVGTDVVVNGSFESHPSVPPPPWTGSFGLFLGVPGAANGTNFAIVSASGFAEQILNTTPGLTYHLSYAVSGNSSFPGTSAVTFTWNGSTTGTATWTSPNTTGDGTHYNWIYGNFDLVATSSLTTLHFERDPSSTQNNSAFLDYVRVIEVPEPSSLALIATSLLLGCGLRKRTALKSL